MPKIKKTEERVPQPPELLQEFKTEMENLLKKVLSYHQKINLVRKMAGSRNMIVQVLTYKIQQSTIRNINFELFGNILFRKLLIKASNTKHRIFNQYRIIKKYFATLEEELVERIQNCNAAKETLLEGN